MSDTSTPVIPADAGLKAGKQPEKPARRGEQLVEAAAGGEGLTPRENDDLVSYFLSNDELPGDSETHELTVKLGHGRSARSFACEVRPIEWSEWQDGRERATNHKSGAIDAFVWSSWNVARALVKPKLGVTVARQQQENPDNAPVDAADLLRRMFRRQSGALLELSAKVLEISKLSNDNESVSEVEAAKN